jgi:hypothetical protein
MAQDGTNNKPGYIKVKFSTDDKGLYNDIAEIMKDNGIKHSATFARMAIVNFVKAVKSGKQKIVQ